MEFLQVLNTKHIKFKSLNYQIATKILKTASYLNLPDKTCKLCQAEEEDIRHIFFTCSFLKPVRKEFCDLLNDWRRDIEGPQFNYTSDTIINMKDIKQGLEYNMISIFKQSIWNSITKHRYEHLPITPYIIIQHMYRTLDFFLTYIY